MQMLCLSTQPTQLQRWQQAFPDGRIAATTQQLNQLKSSDSLSWIHLDCFARDEFAIICEQLQTMQPGSKLIALTGNPTPGLALDCLKMGISGCCHAMADPANLQQVARVIGQGGYWLGEDLLQHLIGTLSHHLVPAKTNKDLMAPLAKLSPREQEVALQVCNGASNREIAETLFISERTIKAHLGSIFQKLSIRDRLQLVLLLKNARD